MPDVGGAQYKHLVYDYGASVFGSINCRKIIPAGPIAEICGKAIRISMEAYETYDQV
jgi:hypothetical protein